MRELRNASDNTNWRKFEFRNSGGQLCTVWGAGVMETQQKRHAKDILAEAGVMHSELIPVKSGDELPTPVTESGW